MSEWFEARTANILDSILTACLVATERLYIIRLVNLLKAHITTIATIATCQT